ncbi:MAG: DMT family transporter [Bdellovibrionales bacterium]
MNPRTAGLLFAATTGVCWALLAIALRNAQAYAGTGTIAWFRMVVAFIVLLIWYAIRSPARLKLLAPKRPLILVCGLGLAINYFAYMRGLEMTTASNAQIMIQMGPLGLLLFGIFYFKESPTMVQTAGLCMAAVGFGLFFWDQILVTFNDAGRYIYGNGWLMLGAFTWAIFAVLQKSLKGDWTPQQFNMVIYGICSLALLPLCDFSEISTWDLKGWLLMLACGANTLIAYGCFAEALRRIPASHVSLVLATNPLLTIFLVTVLAELKISWVIPEPIHWRGFLGALCVVGGVVLTIKTKSAISKIQREPNRA